MAVISLGVYENLSPSKRPARPAETLSGRPPNAMLRNQKHHGLLEHCDRGLGDLIERSYRLGIR
jgi:hypothetical protein